MARKAVYESCPFCGMQDAQVKHSSRWGWFVSCSCTAVGPGRGSKEGAIEAWNSRPEPMQGRLL